MQYFGTDGIRGVFGRQISPELCSNLAKILADLGGKRIIFGADTRAGGRFIVNLMRTEFEKNGKDCIDCGVVTTAELSFLTTKSNADYGIMVTASHNNYKYNGIKIFNGNGQKLSNKQMADIDEKLTIATVEITEKAHNTAWRDFLIEKFDGLRDWKDSPYIIIDCAFGAGAENARSVLSALHLPFEIINDTPDGFNINENCGAVYPRQLLLFVRRYFGNCVGFALDGDGDRCVVVGKTGILHGDKLIALLAQNENQIVATKMFNLGVQDSISAEIVKTDVGDHFVLDEMIKRDINFGGESSGHIIDRRIWASGDGLVTALLFLSKLKDNPKLLDTKIPIMPSINRNVPIIKGKQAKILSAIQEKGFMNTCGVIVRSSGTEDVLRVTVMAKRKGIAKKTIKRIISFVNILIKD